MLLVPETFGGKNHHTGRGYERTLLTIEMFYTASHPVSTETVSPNPSVEGVMLSV